MPSLLLTHAPKSPLYSYPPESTLIRGWTAPLLRHQLRHRRHVLDHVTRELAGLDLGCTFQHALEVEHHHARQHDRPGVDHVFIGILRSCAVRGFEDGVLVSDVRARRNAESANLRRGGVGNIIAVQVGRCQYRVLIGTGNNLLEDAVGDAIVNHQLRLPRPLAVSGVDAVEHNLHLFVERVAEVLLRKLQTGLHHLGVVLDGQSRILVEVADDPALALGDDLVAKLLGSQLVAPLAERAFGELLDVALVHEGHRLEMMGQRVLDGHAHQALGPGNGHRFDTNTGVFTNPLIGACQHFIVKKVNQFLCLGRSLFPLDAGVNVLGVLAVDHYVHALGVLYRRRNALVILNWTNAGIEVEELAQSDV